MPLLLEDLLKPVREDQPAGSDIRYDPVYDAIKEARREDDVLPQGVWQHEAKVADWPAVVKLCRDALAAKSKDLQVSAWLTEALLKKEGFLGLASGLAVCHGLLDNFWDQLYPPIEDDDLETRAAPLLWMAGRLPVVVKSVPLCRDGFNFLQYADSRTLGYEDAAKTKEQKAAREKSIKEGKLAPEIFDKSFGETPKSFYASAEKDLDLCLANLGAFDAVCTQKFGKEAPGFGALKTALEAVRRALHGFLQKKREVEPDPIEEPAPQPPTTEQTESVPAVTRAVLPAVPVSVHMTVAEPPGRAEAIANIVAAAAFLRKQDPSSPAPYLMLRGLRWGELRGSSDPMILEAPPTEIRQQIKMLASFNRWVDLIEAAENVMALPYSRAWLDLQRFVVEGCVALGESYNAVAVAIRSELRVLLRDLPALMTATLTDDTPAANPQTQAWLRDLLAEPADAPPRPKLANAPVLDGDGAPGWQKRFIDPHALAVEALRSGQPQRAVDILSEELGRQRSGRGRFQRKLQLAQMCVAAGKEAIAQPLLDDLAAAVENHKLEDWEDRETVAAVLAFLVQSSKKIQADAKIKAAMFERICRLDPVKAMEVG